MCSIHQRKRRPNLPSKCFILSWRVPNVSQRAYLTTPMREQDRLGGSWEHPRALGKCVVEARAKARLGHQPASGLVSAVPVAGQGRAAQWRGWRQERYSIAGARTDGPRGTEMGSCAMGGVSDPIAPSEPGHKWKPCRS
uniref:Uncharacterized protein n=1 Tax=Bubo bubo TaxID=30461 RepID=A0A8C0IEL4_BUBBB